MSSFYRNPEFGNGKLRFTFSKSEETLELAASRLATLPDRLSTTARPRDAR